MADHRAMRGSRITRVPNPGTPSNEVRSGTGKRRAVKSSRVRQTIGEQASTPGGARRHSRSSRAMRGRRFLVSGPSAHSLVGVGALLVAAVGASLGQGNEPLDAQKATSEGDAVLAAGRSSSAAMLTDRERAVSRDASREALESTAAAQLQNAAEAKAKKRAAALEQLAARATKHSEEHELTDWQLPLPAGSYDFSAQFGECSYLWANCHTGLDLSAPYNTTISSVSAGVVTEAGYDGSYGNKTVVTVDDGTEIWYCHQASLVASVGQRVRPGDVIGYVGATGNTTGPHLHIEVHPGAGDAVDPYAALLTRGVQL